MANEPGRNEELPGAPVLATDLPERARLEEEVLQLRRQLEMWVRKLTGDLDAAHRELENEIIERKQAEEALRRSEREVKRLGQENAVIAEIGWILGSSSSFADLYEPFAREVNKLLPFEKISIHLLDPEKGTIRIAYASGLDMERRRVGDSYALKGSINEIIMHGRSGLLIQAQSMREIADRFPSLVYAFQLGMRSMLSAPLIFKNKVIGVLHLTSFNPKAYTDQDLRLVERIAAHISGAVGNDELFARTKELEKIIRRNGEELGKRLKEHDEMKAGLKLILKYKEDERSEAEEKILSNVRGMILPYIEKLKQGRADSKDTNYLQLLEDNLANIVSPFLNDLKSRFQGLTPKQVQVAQLIKSGKTTKEIAEILHLSVRTIDFHRNNIRKKMGLKEKNKGLASIL